MELKVNRVRLRENLEEMGKNGLDEKGLRNRLALNDGDKQGRDTFCRWIREAGLELKVDPIGNIFGLLAGTEDGNPVTAGSHLDSVRNAGMFDGAVGVLSGLEALRVIREQNVPHRRPIAVVSFTNEEGARFHPDMMGSLVLTGGCSAADACKSVDDDGISVGEELARIGYQGSDHVTPSVYLEYHVEQGPYLDVKKIPLGVVTGVQGITWWQGRFIGQANHAGSTPMNMRHDALLAVSRLHVEMDALAKKEGACFTIGRVNTVPYVINVVPGEASFSIDMRHPDPQTFAMLKKAVDEKMAGLAREYGLTLDVKHTVDVQPAIFDHELVELIAKHADAHGLRYDRMVSGACHDAQMMSHIVPTAMIFVPSVGGMSHCPQELSDMEQIADGADVLLNCLAELAR